MYSELLSAYNKAKKVRRRLQARCGTREIFKPDTTINIRDYDEQMDLLIDAQLIFEVYAKLVENDDDGKGVEKDNKTEEVDKTLLWYVSKPGALKLKKELDKLERYLNDIIREYEKHRNKLDVKTSTYKICAYSRLKDFIGPYRLSDNPEDLDRDFKKKFKDPMEAIRCTLLKEIKEVSLKQDSSV